MHFVEKLQFEGFISVQGYQLMDPVDENITEIGALLVSKGKYSLPPKTVKVRKLAFASLDFDFDELSFELYDVIKTVEDIRIINF